MKNLILITLLTLILSTFSISLYAKNPRVLMKTNKGDITIELFAKKAPKSVANFLKYVEQKFYNGLIFHRVIDNFMIQGGGFSADMTQKKTNAPIINEATNMLKNTNGTLAMARTNVINSATAQFFINVKDNDFLNHRDMSARGFGYAVFGKVVKGMSVVKAIKKVKTHNNGRFQNLPVSNVIIKEMKKL